MHLRKCIIGQTYTGLARAIQFGIGNENEKLEGIAHDFYGLKSTYVRHGARATDC